MTAGLRVNASNWPKYRGLSGAISSVCVKAYLPWRVTTPLSAIMSALSRMHQSFRSHTKKITNPKISLPVSALFLRLKLTKFVCHNLCFRRANGPGNNLTWLWRPGPGHLSHRKTRRRESFCHNEDRVAIWSPRTLEALRGMHGWLKQTPHHRVKKTCTLVERHG